VRGPQSMQPRDKGMVRILEAAVGPHSSRNFVAAPIVPGRNSTFVRSTLLQIRPELHLLALPLGVGRHSNCPGRLQPATQPAAHTGFRGWRVSRLRQAEL
jgi:hypothetical protein